MTKFNQKRLFLLLIIYTVFILCQIIPANAQVASTKKSYLRIGSLQSHVSAYGSERAWNNSYYEGLIWPANYPFQDNAVIKRFWWGAQDFNDAKGRHWDVYAIYFAQSYVDVSLFPVELKQTAKFEPPTVYVDGYNTTSPYAGDVEELNPDQIPDRIVTNVVNTTMGITMTRRFMAFSQQYHDNYFIKEFIFTNTGNVDYDDEIELNATVKGFRISYGTRYSVCREGAMKIGDGQSWGKHTWVSKRGEDYPAHVGDVITANNPIVDWIRCGFSWAGQAANNSYDNIGGPDKQSDGRLCAPQFAGVACLHVDQSAANTVDDPNQPTAWGWQAGDPDLSVGNLTTSDEPGMIEIYNMASGNPHNGLGGTDRMDETYMSTNSDPMTVHNDGGGTNVWFCYGPFDLQPGESIRIIEVEGVNGINRTLCEEIGERWKQAEDDPNDKGPFDLPDGTTTDNRNKFKNDWVYTGMDSILLTFSRAKRNFDMNYQIPQPPLPPPIFNVASGGDRISLSWSESPSASEPGFAGYKVFRGVGKRDTTYQEIVDLGPSETSFDDVTAIRGYRYYYYIVAVNDGSNNAEGIANPTGPLHSGKFYTRTSRGASLKRKPGSSLKDIRVVPNPYSIKARDLQYPGENDKIMFLDIPGKCTIKIFTERGDLIKTIEHTDGSGDEEWDSLTSSRQVVVSGVYIVHFETPDGQRAYRKFVIIR